MDTVRDREASRLVVSKQSITYGAIMLSWLKIPSQADHPMADAKGAASVIEGLSKPNPAHALEVLTEQLMLLRDSHGLKAQRIYEIVDLVDQAAKPYYRKLQQDFLSAPGMTKAQESRIAHVVGSFWLELSTGYRSLMNMFEAGDPSGAALKPQLGTIAARCLRAFGMHLKWRLQRYSAVEGELWRDFGRAYAIAESRGYSTGKVVVYPGLWGDSSVQREVLKPLMLAVSSTDSMTASQVEIAERLCAHFALHFELHRAASTGCHFWFDLDGDHAPSRLADRFAVSPSMRFFGPGVAAQELERLADEIKGAGVLPSTINLGSDFASNEVLEVVEHLQRYWGATPPARREARKASRERIDVVNEFESVIAAVSGDPLDLDFDDRRLSTWGVSNESTGGFGAIAPIAKTEWVKIGMLLGVKYEDGAAWGVGIVRRISNEAQGNRYIGIELFGRGVTNIKLLRLAADGRVSPEAAMAEDALLLPSSADNSLGRMEVTLVMKLGTFSPLKNYGMRMHGMDYVLAPKRLVEAGQDYDIAEYRVVQRSV